MARSTRGPVRHQAMVKIPLAKPLSLLFSIPLQVPTTTTPSASSSLPILPHKQLKRSLTHQRQKTNRSAIYSANLLQQTHRQHVDI